ncbi:TetR/AcrR family transcriptional regulator [Streptomyces reniochalinae]|uniref:TetR/AcrR family transcriptional regulator n=1 Tax=Streptomyces reniochalinae TaxID=2250578 RepID=A0A367EBE7_9ACTN|nr:TetR/AcrR family transcriptional regulator [Streptomyces reniochalinae]RCG15388.1 TetR/AcrR family transcriptional regulator [Streptomyces reniochalinae]
MEANSAATGRAAAGETRASGGKEGRYHHGDLRNALIRAAIELAAEGGPDAVVLRAAARKVGVSATAAYRHFEGQSDLLGAVKEYGQQRLVACMEAVGRASEGVGPQAARDRMMELGRGYVRFAREEPGLYRTAFCRKALGAVGITEEGGLADAEGEQPGWETRSFELLTETLDDAVTAGLITPERRPGAELSAWAMVHGVAMLFLDGPLDTLTDEESSYVIDRVLTDVLAGLMSP